MRIILSEGQVGVFNLAKNAGAFSRMVIGRAPSELITIEQKCSAVTVNFYR